MAPPTDDAGKSSESDAGWSSDAEQDSPTSSARSSVASFDVVVGRGEVSEWHDVGANAQLMKVD